MLLQLTIIFVSFVFFIFFAIEEKAGAKKGIQNLIITISGFSDKIYLAVLHQLRGFIEFINGDILCEKSAMRALKDSNCDGIMIGRGLMGNPWLIKKLSKKVFNIEAERNDTVSKISILEEHVEDIYSFYGTRLGNLKARKHIKWYLKNFNIPESFQKELLNCTEKSKLFSLFKVLKMYEN